MKNKITKIRLVLIIALAHLLISSSIFAQAPQKMSYQAVIRNSNDSLLVSTPVGMRISLVQSSPTGTVVYSETQTTTTNANGLVSLQIGTGTAVSGTFAGIDWAAGPYYVKTETDLSGGTNYTIISSNELLSVPYALFSANGTPGPAGPIGLTGETGAQGATGLLSIGTAAGNTPYWNGSQWVVNGINLYNNGSNLGIGTTTPNASAITEMNSTTQGFLPPRMTTLQRDAIVEPAAGLTIYNTTVNCLQWWNGTIWYDGCGNNTPSTTQPQYAVGTVYCAGPTAVVDVTNPTTGKTWMDRNLGATQVATSSTDVNSYGDLYQWGRRADGHQCRTSSTTATLSSIDQPANGNFILTQNAPYDWRSPQNINLWQGVNGVNNPCPSGYRVPSETEINAERLSWSQNNSVGAFASLLKWTLAAGRSSINGTLFNVGSGGYYYSSTVIGTSSRALNFDCCNAGMYDDGGATGRTVRCIKNASAIPAAVGTLNCGGAITTGTLTNGTAASGVSSAVSYTGGNLGSYSTQTTTSTGVTGLTATLSAGVLANGPGSLTYTIIGTPTTSGTATFAITVGGLSCSFTVSVGAQSQYPEGTVHCADATTIVDVTNPTTGKTWMDRNLGATQVATSSTDVASYGDLYQWGRRADGHQCRTSATTAILSSIDQPAHGNFITVNSGTYDWRSPQNTNLWQGVNGVNNPCPSGYRIPTETEINSERLSWGQQNSSGAFSSPLKLPVAGYLDLSDGSLDAVGTYGRYWSSTTDSGTNSRHLYFYSSNTSMNANRRADGFSVRCIKEIVGALGTLNCGGSTTTGILTNGTAASGVSTAISYIGGNGGSYAAQTISSTGVTGLTATLYLGILSNGAGSLIYTITGTPTTSGTATFAITIGGQSCSFTVSVADTSSIYPAGTVNCAAGATAVVDVTNPTTGKTWMDRNLGATQVATSSTDINSYGDLYQWGRRADGHQCRTSSTTATLSSIDQPANGNFILTPNAPYDWRSPQNINLWQGVNGVNNPCPSGYRVPSETEINAERISWSQNNSVGAFASPLKWTLAGFRNGNDGSLGDVGNVGSCWSSTVGGSVSRNLFFFSFNAVWNVLSRAYGFSVRCIKETEGVLGTLNCGSTNTIGSLTNGTAASSVSAAISYTGGNAGTYAAQTVSSTGVVGLTSTLDAGSLANGAGSLTYTITGTPTTSGTASFAITVGGQSCSFTMSVGAAQTQYPLGTVNCAGATTVVDVTNPTTGKTWMDRNLGATQVDTSSTDANSYGDLYQWGRRADGHQCRTSPTTANVSSIDQPAHGNFIKVNSGNQDWRSPQNTNLWQGVNGVNNPCPSTYRLPTDAELTAELQSWGQQNSAGAFSSPLKLLMAGYREVSNGSLFDVGTSGYYWSSTVSGTLSRSLYFASSNAYLSGYSRAYGFSVRCLKYQP